MRRHLECADRNKIYPMGINGDEAVMACRSFVSFVSQKG